MGHRHWGLFGAAGLLIVRDDEVLLQLRSPRTHNGDTWSVPGGARDIRETPARAALREAEEEIGLSPADVELLAEVVDDHGGWSYTTVIARLLRPVNVVQNHESAQVRWVPAVEVTALRLHEGFASSWPRVAESIAALRTNSAPAESGGAGPG